MGKVESIGQYSSWLNFLQVFVDFIDLSKKLRCSKTPLSQLNFIIKLSEIRFLSLATVRTITYQITQEQIT